MVLISAHRTHTHSQETTYMHTLLLLYFAQHTTLPQPTTIHILNLSYEIMYSNNETILYYFIFKAVYNYVYLFTSIFYYPKIHLSYILLFIQNKTLV